MISLIVAAAENNVIGRGGDLPWRLSADLQRFKQLTWGHPMVMGRRTWQSIGRPLPGRTSIVVSRQQQFSTGFAEVAVVADIEAALAKATAGDGGDREVFVIGGAQVYAAALPRASTIYLTRVAAEVDGDVLLPPVDWSRWHQIDRSSHRADAKNQYDYAFETYRRTAPDG